MDFAMRCRLAAKEFNLAAWAWEHGMTQRAKEHEAHGVFLADEKRQREVSEKAVDEILAALERH